MQTSLFCDDPIGPSEYPACSVDGCDKPRRRDALCWGHYKRKLRGQSLDGPLEPRSGKNTPRPICSITGCTLPVISQKNPLCQPHDYRTRKGLPLDTPVRKKPRVQIADIIAHATERGGQCLNSQDYRNPDTQLQWRCSAGHVWPAPWNGVKYGGSWCAICNTANNGISERTARRILELMFKAPFPKDRPDWLKTFKAIGVGQELDGYNEDLRMGFEYQGAQHYEPVALFGNKSLAKQHEQDARKRKACWDNNVTLIVIHEFPDVNNVEATVNAVTRDVMFANVKVPRDWEKRRPRTLAEIHTAKDFAVPTWIIRKSAERGWTCLSETYGNIYTILDWKCQAGHIWHRPWEQVRNKQACTECTKAAKPTHCSVEGCDRPIGRRGLCWGHASRLEKNSSAKGPIKVTKKNTALACTAPNCSRPSFSHDLCSCHYRRWQKGKPLDTPARTQPNRKPTMASAQAIATQKGGTCLSTAIQKVSDHLMWQCSLGHDPWRATFGQVAGHKGKPDGTWCPTCCHLARRGRPSPFKKTHTICSISGCTTTQSLKGLCRRHYKKETYRQKKLQRPSQTTMNLNI